ncbi:MAG: hypothetical protein ACKPBB_15650 [Sphaerospermopsis kisseleviana]
MVISHWLLVIGLLIFPSPQSPITNHQSPVPSDALSLSKCHQSPITSPQSPVPNHQSPITSPQSPVTSHQSPITSPQSPVN